MKKSGSFRQSNKGESLVLVTIFSTIVIGIVATLTVISAMLLYKAGYEKSHNQAYEIATSLSARIEELILNGVEGVVESKSQIDLDTYKATLLPPEAREDPDKPYSIYLVYISKKDGFFEGIPDASATAVVTAVYNEKNAGVIDYYVLTVTATAAGEEYIKTTEYSGDINTGYKKR